MLFITFPPRDLNPFPIYKAPAVAKPGRRPNAGPHDGHRPHRSYKESVELRHPDQTYVMIRFVKVRLENHLHFKQ